MFVLELGYVAVAVLKISYRRNLVLERKFEFRKRYQLECLFGKEIAQELAGGNVSQTSRDK